MRHRTLLVTCVRRVSVLRARAARFVSSSVKAYPNIFVADLSNDAITVHFAIPSMKDRPHPPGIKINGPLSRRELFPDWMQFLHGEVSFPDMGTFRSNGAFRKEMTEMFLQVLKKEKERSPAKYEEFWGLYHDDVINGIATGEIHIDLPVLGDLLLFKDPATQRLLPLNDWVARKVEGDRSAFADCEAQGATPEFRGTIEKEIFTSASALLAASAAAAASAARHSSLDTLSDPAHSSNPSPSHIASTSSSSSPPHSDSSSDTTISSSAAASGNFRDTPTPFKTFVIRLLKGMGQVFLVLSYLEIALWLLFVALIYFAVYLLEKQRREREEQRRREEEEREKKSKMERGYLASARRWLSSKS